MESWLDPVYDAEGMAAADRWAIEEAGVPSLDLMEAAGRGLARATAEMAVDRQVTVICGKGNNGGDGLVAARHLLDSGFDVRVILMGAREELSPDSAANFDRLEPGVVAVTDRAFTFSASDGVLIDAILGTGFAGEPREPVAGMIAAINESGLPVLACDVPSGVDASSGEAIGPAVQADRTVTFHRRKIGHLINPAKGLCGSVEVVPIGIPGDAPKPDAGGVIGLGVLDLLPRRGTSSNKFTSGRVSIVGGSRGLTGAVCLAAEASIRAGAGYATAAVPGGLENTFEAKLTEVMTRGFGGGVDHLGAEQSGEVLRHLEGAAAVIVGSGAGRESTTAELTARVAIDCQSPVVLDADGLSTFGTDLGRLESRGFPTVLTPHEGEAGRLLGCSSTEVSSRRVESARALARSAGAVVLLKGDGSIITDGERLAVNALSSPALATAGTGDVLAGMVGAFLARGLDAFEAAAAATIAHARAGELAAIRVGNRDGVIASDVIQEIPRGMLDVVTTGLIT